MQCHTSSSDALALFRSSFFPAQLPARSNNQPPLLTLLFLPSFPLFSSLARSYASIPERRRQRLDRQPEGGTDPSSCTTWYGLAVAVNRRRGAHSAPLLADRLAGSNSCLSAVGRPGRRRQWDFLCEKAAIWKQHARRRRRQLSRNGFALFVSNFIHIRPARTLSSYVIATRHTVAFVRLAIPIH